MLTPLHNKLTTACAGSQAASQATQTGNKRKASDVFHRSVLTMCLAYLMEVWELSGVLKKIFYDGNY